MVIMMMMTVRLIFKIFTYLTYVTHKHVRWIWHLYFDDIPQHHEEQDGCNGECYKEMTAVTAKHLKHATAVYSGK